MNATTTRQDKINATIQRLTARLEKLNQPDALAKYMKKPNAEDRMANGQLWGEILLKIAKEETQNALENNLRKLADAKRLDAKEDAAKAKKAAKEKKIGELPAILADLRNEMTARFAKNWVETWERLRALPYPEYHDRSWTARDIREAYVTTREEIEEDAARSAEALVLNLWTRVEEKCGKVTKIDLYLNRGNWQEGSALNGAVMGEKGTARVMSVEAGGYNIQRLHVRVLVK